MIKKFILLLSITASLAAGGFWADDFDTARAEAAQSGKIIMIEAVREVCRYCRIMEHEVFSDTQVQQELSSRFVPLKVDIGKESLPLGIRARVTPSFYFVDTKGNVVKKLVGAWTKEDFLEIVHTIGE